jgi:hypothetical protein
MARHNDMIRVNGKKILTPSVFQPSLQDISAADAGRTQDTIMHKNRKGKKRKIQLAWNGVNKEQAHSILQAFKDEYFRVTYYDPWEGDTITKTSYSGDQSAPVKTWMVNKKIYEQVSFDIIER